MVKMGMFGPESDTRGRGWGREGKDEGEKKKILIIMRKRKRAERPP